MSIDTAAKRRSVSGILTGLTIVGVTMDATPDVAWRQSAGWGYQGIATAALPVDMCEDGVLRLRFPPEAALTARMPPEAALTARMTPEVALRLRC